MGMASEYSPESFVRAEPARLGPTRTSRASSSPETVASLTGFSAWSSTAPETGPGTVEASPDSCPAPTEANAPACRRSADNACTHGLIAVDPQGHRFCDLGHSIPDWLRIVAN